MAKYTAWKRYFASNNWTLDDFPWTSSPLLSEAERALVASSLPQFQLGEGSAGLGLIARAEDFARRRGLPGLPETIRAFIKEEQRHSAVLGRFQQREGIPMLREHWVDLSFRRVRKLAGFEAMITVLVTAECIAVPYYAAVHQSTSSPLLKAISRRILLDEDEHLNFQAENLALCHEGRGEWCSAAILLLHAALLTAACALVYAVHHRLCRAAGYSFGRFWVEAVGAFGVLSRRVTGASPSRREQADIHPEALRLRF